MMAGSKSVKERIEQLIERAPPEFQPANQLAWLIAAQNSVQLVCPSRSNAYCVQAERLLTQANRWLRPISVQEMAALLTRLLEEIEGGLLTTIENHSIAIIFDDFLDHGSEYLKQGRKNEAAVIAGIVFEDTLRRICRVLDIAENSVPLEALIAELVKRDVITELKAKRARAAAGLRTSAAHARWEQIQLGDVNPVIEFTKELMAAHLE
jgi:hypothetical protein